jgi:transcriptional regulator with XRE-family HTH domain
MSAREHGERRCYLAGCRRPECLDAHYRYMSRYNLDRNRGKLRRVDSKPVSDHLKKMHDAGWSDKQIAERSGAKEGTIWHHRNRKHPTISRELSDRILAVEVTAPSGPGGAFVDSVGSMRRLRALSRMGYTAAHIAKEVKLSTHTIGELTSGSRSKVSASTARVIADLYERWSATLGPSVQTRRYAERKEWGSPLVWDNIDDPNEEPNFGKQVSRVTALAEDCFELVEKQGYTRALAAERLGVKRDALDVAISRYRGQTKEQEAAA